jgi:hypothetical protein
MTAARQHDMPLSFSVGDRVCHAEHGDGVVTGSYGIKLAVDFDHIGTKRVAVESLIMAPWMRPEALAEIYAERDASRAKAQAAVERWKAQQAERERQAELQRHRGPAEVIPFPTSRIVRTIRHGKPVKARTIK